MRLPVLLSLAVSSAVIHGAETTFAPTEFPFAHEDGMLWVKVHAAGGAEPLNFLLDSGAEVSVVHLETARRRGLTLGRRVNVRGVRTLTTGYWPQRLAATAQGVALPEDYLALDLAKLSKACGRRVDGLIGADFFRDRIVQMDFEAGMIRLLNTTSSLARDVSVPLEVRRCGLRVQVAVNGRKPQWVRLDTGCASALQWVTWRIRPDEHSDRFAIGLAEVTIDQARTTVALGGLIVADVPTGLHRKAIFPGEAGLLGTGLLARFKSVTVDARGMRLILDE